MEIIKKFLVGSSGIIPLLFYIIYFNISNKDKIVSNETYALLVPIYFGLMNIFMTSTKEYFKLNSLTSILVTSFISSLLVFSVAYSNKVYIAEDMNWQTYYIALFILHFIAYSVISSFNMILL